MNTTPIRGQVSGCGQIPSKTQDTKASQEERTLSIDPITSKEI